MKRTNTVSNALNTGNAMLDPGDGLPLIPIPLDGQFPGRPGPAGPGVPEGGTAGQYIEKTSDGSTQWATPSKSKVGLSNVDNTSDANKPISNATRDALDTKPSQIEIDFALQSKADLSNGKVPVSQLPTDVLVTDANVAAQVNGAQTGAAIDARITTQATPLVQPIVADYIASDQTIVDAAAAAVDANPTILAIEARELPDRGRATLALFPDGIDSIKTKGVYQVWNSTDFNALGLPGVPGQGVLRVTPASNAYVVQEWMAVGNGKVNTYTRMWTGSVWWAWSNPRWENTSILTADTNMATLQSGVHAVASGSVSTALGLPSPPSSGSLWVHNVSATTGRMEWKPTNSTDVWHSAKHGGAGWSEWEKPADTAPTPPTGEITGVSLALADTGMAYIPHAIGTDGLLYGTNTGESIPFRSGDSLATEPELGPNLTQWTQAGTGVKYFIRTSAGYVFVWRVDEMNHEIYFSESWDGPYAKVHSMGPFHYTGLAAPILIGGVTWLVVGDYTNSTIPSVTTQRHLSVDGGRTWTVIRSIAPVNDQVNNHCHTALIRPNGRIYVSDGDGVNNWFGYTDDRGESWVKVDTDPDINLDTGGLTSQPTLMIDHGDRITLSPDRGPYTPGMWTMDAATHRMAITFPLSQGGPYNDASKQYARSVFAQVGPQGKEAYALMPDGGSGNKTTYIVSTPDGGRRWGIVATIPSGTGRLENGIIGPDRNGNIFLRGTGDVPTYGGNVIRAPIIRWDKALTA